MTVSTSEDESRRGPPNVRSTSEIGKPLTRLSVKPLEWTAEENGEFLAVSAVGWYHIGYPVRSWNLTMPSGEVPSFGDDLDAAKAAAQADYSARSISPVDGEPTPSTHVDVEDVREQKLATIVAPDNGTPDEVLSYVLECAKAWVPEARIIGNARAGDIARAIEALPSPQPRAEPSPTPMQTEGGV